MALAPVDETNLLLPLFDGLFEQPLWETFLRRLAQRTGADRVRLTISNPASPGQSPLRRRVLADRLAEADPGEPEAFDAALYSALRPGRVYSLDELRDYDSPAQRDAQREALIAARIGDARLIRIASRGDLNAWIVLLSERATFSAADSALLTSLAPAVATALALFAEIGALRLREETARETLALLGIEQAVLDKNGHALAAEQGVAALPPTSLAEACAELSAAPPEARKVAGDVLLRPSGRNRDGLTHPAAAIAIWRNGRRENEVSGARVLAATYGLSQREAALAEAISRGKSIVDAGRALQLTPETARNYSKRIYAKTGTSGQADLVRLVLEGLAVLA